MEDNIIRGLTAEVNLMVLHKRSLINGVSESGRPSNDTHCQPVRHPLISRLSIVTTCVAHLVLFTISREPSYPDYVAIRRLPTEFCLGNYRGSGE